ncbi:MAG: MFS transporter [Candidatus Bathyarchaeota archaeon]
MIEIKVRGIMERLFVYICVTNFLKFLAWSCTNLLYSLFAVSLGAQPAVLGILFSILALARFLTDNPSGMLVHRIGRKNAIIIGLGIIAFSYVLFSLAKDANSLFVAMSIFGVGWAISDTASNLYAANIAPTEKRASYMGIFQGMTMIASIVGPPFGGFIAEIYGLRMSFITSTLISVAALLSVLIYLKEDRVKEKSEVKEKKSATLQRYTTVLKDRLLLSLFIAAVLTAFEGPAFRNIALPVYATQVLGVSIVELTLIESFTNSANIAVRFFLIRMLEGRFSRRALIIMGHLIRGVSICFLGLAPEYYALLALSSLSGLGLGLFSPFVEALWIDSTTDNERSLVYGIRNSFIDFGSIINSNIITLLFGIEIRFPFYFVGLVSILNGYALFWIIGHFKKSLKANY